MILRQLPTRETGPKPLVCWIPLVLIAAAIAACGSVGVSNYSGWLPAGEDPCKPPNVGFFVMGVEAPGLSNVKVYLVANEKTAFVGRTDGFGFICVPYDLITSPGAQAIVFCKKDFFCGGFLTANENFLQIKERLMVLAPSPPDQ